MKFRSPTNQDIQINLLSGHSATVTPEWCDIHPMFHRDALAEGCISDNMSEAAIAAGVVVDGGTSGVDRKGKLRDALEAMILDANKDDFTQSGQPKIGAVRDRVGFGVEREEMMEAWNAISEADDLP